MAVRELCWSVFMCVTMMYSVDCIAFHERARWIMLGEESAERDNVAGIEVDRYNVSLPVFETTEIAYNTKNGKRINCIIAASSSMNGFVSLQNGGLEDNHVTVRYTSENGDQDEFFVFVESYKIEALIINDDMAEMKNLVVVTNDMRNWTGEIFTKVQRG